MTKAMRLALATMVLAAASVASAQQARSEFEVKAAYLYNFARFVQWPTRAGGDGSVFAICVLGADPFGRTLDSTLSGLTLGGAKVIARRIAAPADARTCRIVFIAASEEDALAAVLRTLASSDVLTVSDIPRFVDRGGMVQFVTEGGRIRFAVAIPPAQAAGLMFSSELLRVAALVRSDPVTP